MVEGLNEHQVSGLGSARKAEFPPSVSLKHLGWFLQQEIS